MTILIQGKTYKLFSEDWLNVTAVGIEDKGMMSYSQGDDPKPKLVVYFKPEGAQDGETISVLCTNSRHPDSTLHKICMAALRYIPKVGEDLEALLIGKPLKAKNVHRVSSKDKLAYNQLKDFLPSDPPAEGRETKPGTQRPGKSGPRVKLAGRNGIDSQILEDTITDKDVPF